MGVAVVESHDKSRVGRFGGASKVPVINGERSLQINATSYNGTANVYRNQDELSIVSGCT